MPLFESAYGHFSEDGREYVVTRPDTPRPWVNVISNGDWGLVVSQAGGGFSWRGHSNLNRITRWSQDLMRDEWGKFVYLRDEEDGAFWSATYQPTHHEPEAYRCRHGVGYSVTEQRHRGVESALTVLAAPDSPCEIWRLEVKNVSDRPRRLSATSYFEWNLGAPDPHREFHKLFLVPEADPETGVLYARKLLWEVPTDRGHWNTDWEGVAFHGASEAPVGFECDKAAFMGRHRGPDRPAAMAPGVALSGRADRWGDAIGSLRLACDLAPGESKTFVFTLGAAGTREEAAALAARYKSPEAADAALAAVKADWEERLGAVWLETPDPATDLLTNVWLKYQAISGHLWARAAYYQQSGAYGFRDQLQTSQIWLPIRPDGMREQLLLHARHQLAKGTVLHWWHPMTEQGHATDMTDDMLWLPYMAIPYLRETADAGLLGESVTFHDGGEASFEEHCKRAIAVVLGRMSPRGLPLIGEGDWCDGFSAVGLAWKGESIWLGHFLHRVLLDWAELLERRANSQAPFERKAGTGTAGGSSAAAGAEAATGPQADLAQAAAWRAAATALQTALETHGWNGQWYICATKDDGSPMGDPSCTENQIYLNSQTWAVLGGAASPDRARQAMAAALERLEGDNGTVLFRPAYHTVDRYIGYITRYAPGLRENGGVYTHAAVWSIFAQAELGDPDGALRLHRKLNPMVTSPKDPDRYVAEPYVLPGNIDGFDSPLYGRAGWSWYTGSAGWMFTAGVSALTGVAASYEGLSFTPRLPEGWDHLRLRRRFRGCEYDLKVRRDPSIPKGESRMTVDGQPHAGGPLPHFADTRVHEVEVLLP